MQFPLKENNPLKFRIPSPGTYELLERIVPILFYLALIGLSLIWIMLGNTFYSRVIPFYDSLVYQTQAESIVRAYQNYGWGAVSEYGFDGPNSFLYIPLLTILAPVLPLSRTILYIYLIPIHLVALGVLFDFLHRKTHSLALALLGPFLYISTTPFRILEGGVLDQRMDLATASFTLLLWVTALDWAEDSTSVKKAAVLGLTAALAFMHRPVISIQTSLIVIMILLYAFWIARQLGQVKSFLRSLGLVVLISGTLSIPWFVTNTYAFYRYYVLNTTVIGITPLTETIPGYLRILGSLIGKNLLILIGCFFLLALILRRFSWKYFLLSSGVIILPLVTLILSGAYSTVVAEISLAGVGLLPLVFVKRDHSDYGVKVIAALAVIMLAVSNLISLGRVVNDIKVEERLQVEQAILALAGNETDEPIYLSSFISAGGGPAAIASIARLDLGIPMYTGIFGFHPIQFGLSSKSIHFSEEELDRATACGLYKALNADGILMLVEPSQVNEKEIQDWLFNQVFSNQLSARMDQMALASGRLKDTGVTATFSDIPVHFYDIKPGENIPVENCPP